MSDSQGKRFNGNHGPPRVGREERNGFKNARILPVKVDEGQRAIYKREANEILRKFFESGHQNTTLPAMLRDQRKIMHEVAQQNGLVTRSIGKEPNRYMILSIRENRLTRSSLIYTEPIAPTAHVLSALTGFIADNPVTREEMDNFLIESNTKKHKSENGSLRGKTGIPPKACCPKDLQKVKEQLPASKYKERVLKSIDSDNIVIISGGTGCGKTTQVPQFILEDAHDKKKHVRIMVTQPRRIAAISISERVARERGERLGDTVGYHVRLEKRNSEKTLLTYCTVGVLLRMLTADPLATGITHIVMDEIHEREINTDFSLIALRECMKKRPDLKLILMSATIEGNMQLFSKYFENVDIIRIESRTFDVKVFYLDQILAMSGYQPLESQMVFYPPFDFDFEHWGQEIKSAKENKRNELTRKEVFTEQSAEECSQFIFENAYDPTACESTEPTCLDSSQINFTNQEIVSNCVTNTSKEWVSGSYSTPDGDIILERTMNSFMDVAGASDIRPIITEPAVKTRDLPTLSLPLQSSTNSEQVQTPSTSGLCKFSTDEFGFGEKRNTFTLLAEKFKEDLLTTLPGRTLYYHPKMNDVVDRTDFQKLRFAEKYNLFYGSNDDSSIDRFLLDHVIRYLADSPVFGTILVFLPGYDDIQVMMTMIQKWRNNLTNMKYVNVIPLHSQIHNINHGDIFKPVNNDTRKIILATNIAEASITIEDVIFVVDTGKVKEKSYNHDAKLNTLATTTIAKSNAEQRAGRAGRVTNGYCIRLYSEEKFNAMPETQMAEMKRAAIYEVTLHAKCFAPNRMKIADFLALAPEPPEKRSITQSMSFLEQLGAFYTPKKYAEGDVLEKTYERIEEEPELTDLGKIMARLPLDPQLSRMLLFGLALKCLTPVVNLVALLASRDPYILPLSEERDRQSNKKHDLAQQDYSDHLMYIRLCSEFCSKTNTSQQNYFCRENYLNANTMRMVNGTRRQLLQELVRASLIKAPSDRDIMTILTDSAYNKNSESWAMVQAAIAAGCYPFIGVSSSDSLLKKVQTFNDQPAALHPSSMLKKQVLKLNKQLAFEKGRPRLEYVVFQEMCLLPSDRALTMKTVTAIPALTALMFTGPIKLSQSIVEEFNLINEEDEEEIIEEEAKRKRSHPSTLNMDEWYGVKADRKILCLLLRLRHKFMQFFVKGLVDSSVFGLDTTSDQKKMLEVIRHLLESGHQDCYYSPVQMPGSNPRPVQNYNNSTYKKTLSHKEKSPKEVASKKVASKKVKMEKASLEKFPLENVSLEKFATKKGATEKLQKAANAIGFDMPPKPSTDKTQPSQNQVQNGSTFHQYFPFAPSKATNGNSNTLMSYNYSPANAYHKANANQNLRNSSIQNQAYALSPSGQPDSQSYQRKKNSGTHTQRRTMDQNNLSYPNSHPHASSSFGGFPTCGDRGRGVRYNRGTQNNFQPKLPTENSAAE